MGMTKQRISRWVIGLGSVLFVGCQALLSDSEIVDEDKDEDDLAAICDNYCETVQESCQDSLQQYATTQQCKAVCLTLDEGDESDETGNTISCRNHYALEATEDPDLCSAAGPGGDGICGSNCEGFCHVQAKVCNGKNEVYPTITECVSACDGFDNTVVHSSNVTSGDSLACRITHLTLATGSPAVHCPHIVPDSPVCVATESSGE